MKLFIFLCILLLNAVLFAQNTTETTVFFDPGSSLVSNDARKNLSVFMTPVKKNNVLAIRLTGFADDIGSDEINDRISLDRAKAVKQELIKLGFAEDIFDSVLGAGSIPLKFSTDQKNIEQIRRKNRNVEVRILLQPTLSKNVAAKSDEIKGQALFSKETKVGERIRLNNLLFEPGSHNMYPQSIVELNRLLFYLKKYKNIHISILGHICCQPDGQDGVDKETGLQNLSEARAQAVYYYLVQKGIDKNRLEFVGKKGNFPLGLGDQQDRRVEIEIVKN